jgi:LPPG:FO 2-phospho-L-lactate transferase
MNVVALAGGVGGAKLAEGLALVLPPEALTVIVNTADDFEHLGLLISPDLDTVTYTLAGLANLKTGWGRADETWTFLETLQQFGGPTWFHLGDKDLALHHERTRRLRLGEPLNQVTRRLGQQLGVRVRVLPMSDERVATMVRTEEGDLPFQEYLVARRCEPRVIGFRFSGIEQAKPAPGVLESLQAADLVLMCPSNPWVSLDPILAVPGVREAVSERPVVGISPIVGGQALKGPAAKMFDELGICPTARAVAEHYAHVLTGFVVDHQDAEHAPAVESLGLRVLVTHTIMRSTDDRERLARETLEFAQGLHR